MLTRSTFDRSRTSLARAVTGGSILPFVRIESREIIMPVIWCHVESVVNQPTSPPSLVLNMRTPFATRRSKCMVGMDTRILKGFERLSFNEIRPGDFVIATITEHSDWLETQRIEVIVFEAIQ